MTAFIRQSSLSLLLLLCLLGHNSAFSHGEAKADWIHVGGNVDFEGIPLCALVLINGVSQFSCNGNGRYDMEVPADQNGMITVQVFVDGFAPFYQIVTPDQAAAYPVAMVQDQGSPSLDVGAIYEPSATEGRLVVSGSITIGGAPVCALVLANGVSMFSCGGAGQYSLDVPLDSDGDVTLMVFAAGFKPYKVIADPDTDDDGIFDADDACPQDPSPDCEMAALPTVKLYVKGYFGSSGSLFDNLFQPIGSISDCFGEFFCSGSFEEVSFPYSSSGTVSANVTGIPTPTESSLGIFKILGEGGDFTIINLRATDSTNRVTPRFAGISNNFAVVDGREITFDLVSPLTRGSTVNLNYRFEIRETGDTFSVSYLFKSN